MSNELVKLGFNDLARMADAFAKSNMFQDCKQAAQALVKIQAGQELGVAPFASMSGIHIIAGKPVVGAGLIASRIKASNKYDYKVLEHSDVKCVIEFYQGKTLLGTSSFSIEDARKAQTKNLEKFPKNMLFARAISNGAKWFTPDVFSGPIYTPEDFGETETTPVEDAAAKVVSTEIKPSPEAKQSPDNQQIEPQQPPQPEVGTESPKVPGAWIAKMEKCKTIADILEVYRKNKETIEAHRHIFEYVFDSALPLMERVPDAVAFYVAAKTIIENDEGYKERLSRQRNSILAKEKKENGQ